MDGSMLPDYPDQKMEDPSFQLLLLLSRLSLSEEQIQIVSELLPCINDWEGFTRQASDRFVLPIVHGHLCKYWKAQVPKPCLDIMKFHAMRALQYNLNVAAEFKGVVRDVLLPLGVAHLCFKGPTLAFQYYNEPAQRICRDVDILVPKDDLPRILQYALSKGYKPHDPKKLTNSDESLNFVARYQKVVTLISPRNVAVEFHTKIDNTATVYDASQMLEKRQPVTVNNVDTWVMPFDELFVYLCWHHTKHYWSRLHWLVDITALQDHKDFNYENVIACAERYALVKTVTSCLDMIGFFSAPTRNKIEDLEPNTRQLVRTAIFAMHGDIVFEHSLSRKNPTPAFSFSWQTSRSQIWRWRLLGWRRIFRPTYNNYAAWPLSLRWQWVYRFIRPFQEAFARLTHNVK